MKTKGISDIIAIVLLLMITISMVGFAWIWMQRLTLSAQNTTTSQVDTLSGIAGQNLKIDNINKAAGEVTIRNVGTSNVNTSTIMIYVNGSVRVNGTACGWPIGGRTIAPGAFDTCTNITTTPPPGGIIHCGSIRMVTASGEDSRNC